MYFEIVTVVTSGYDENGFLAIQPSAFGTSGGSKSGMGFYPQSLPLGYFARPLDRNSDGVGSTALIATEGGKGVAWCIHEPRLKGKLPTLTKGSRMIVNDDGSYTLWDYEAQTCTTYVPYLDNGVRKEHKIVVGKDSLGYPTISLTHGDGGDITLTKDKIRAKAPTVHVDSPNVLLGENPGNPVACVGDLVAVVVPAMIATNASGPGPVTPVVPTLITPTGGITAIGQIMSGRPGTQS